ncbi:MAG: autotransporter outer membrane beta-barrel domain-containing protein, partial [Proteobacteria bacterium]|nr:autotransporter outer membrane beta-barrel domain-containing protein [Pseudomonadota bacterium]
SDYTATEYGVGATYGCGNGFEFYGGYLRSQFDRHSGSGYDINTWNIGFRFHFNGGTVQDYTNHGPSWNGAAVLTDTFSRW